MQTSLAEIKEQVSNLLQLEPGSGSQGGSALQVRNKDGTGESPSNELQRSQLRLVQALSEYLHHSQQKIDHSRCVEVVANQLWNTLYDYPCLKNCQPLLKYIRTSVNLAWGLSNLVETVASQSITLNVHTFSINLFLNFWYYYHFRILPVYWNMKQRFSPGTCMSGFTTLTTHQKASKHTCGPHYWKLAQMACVSTKVL